MADIDTATIKEIKELLDKRKATLKKMREYSKAWRKRNPGYHTIKQREYRARKKARAEAEADAESKTSEHTSL